MIVEIPHLVEPTGRRGWTVSTFASAREAAAFVLSNPNLAVRCWRRFEIVGGALVVAR